MNFLKGFKSLMSKKEKGKVSADVSSKLPNIPSANQDDEKIPLLSYGIYTIPVEAFVEGVKRGAVIKAYCELKKDFIPLKELGEELYLYNPKLDMFVSLIHNEDEEFEYLRQFIFEGKNTITNNNYNSYDDDSYKEDEEE